MNYTRGVLYWVAEPQFHTGLRASYQLTDEVTFRLMAVNGWNNTIDNNSASPSARRSGSPPSNSSPETSPTSAGPSEATR